MIVSSCCTLLGGDLLGGRGRTTKVEHVTWCVTYYDAMVSSVTLLIFELPRSCRNHNSI
jgi:hypothetical protein